MATGLNAVATGLSVLIPEVGHLGQRLVLVSQDCRDGWFRGLHDDTLAPGLVICRDCTPATLTMAQLIGAGEGKAGYATAIGPGATGGRMLEIANCCLHWHDRLASVDLFSFNCSKVCLWRFVRAGGVSSGLVVGAVLYYEVSWKLGLPYLLGMITQPSPPSLPDVQRIFGPGFEYGGVLGVGGSSVVYAVLGEGKEPVAVLKMANTSDHNDEFDSEVKVLEKLETTDDLFLRVLHSDAVFSEERQRHEYVFLEPVCTPFSPICGFYAQHGMEVLQAVYSLHCAGWVHRDIRSSNIMQDPTGRVRLIDLGCALPAGFESFVVGTIRCGSPRVRAAYAGVYPVPFTVVDDLYSWAYTCLLLAYPQMRFELDEVCPVEACRPEHVPLLARFWDETARSSTRFAAVLATLGELIPTSKFTAKLPRSVYTHLGHLMRACLPDIKPSNFGRVQCCALVLNCPVVRRCDVVQALRFKPKVRVILASRDADSVSEPEGLPPSPPVSPPRLLDTSPQKSTPSGKATVGTRPVVCCVSFRHSNAVSGGGCFLGCVT